MKDYRQLLDAKIEENYANFDDRIETMRNITQAIWERYPLAKFHVELYMESDKENEDDEVTSMGTIGDIIEGTGKSVGEVEDELVDLITKPHKAAKKAWKKVKKIF